MIFCIKKKKIKIFPPKFIAKKIYEQKNNKKKIVVINKFQG